MIRQRAILKVIPFLLTVTVLGSGAAYGQIDESLEKQLGLTQQQRQKIEDLREQFNEDSAPIKSRIRELQNERKELESSGASQAKVKSVLHKIADQEIELSLLLNQFKRNYLAVFTDEQLEKLRQLKKQRESN